MALVLNKGSLSLAEVSSIQVAKFCYDQAQRLVYFSPFQGLTHSGCYNFRTVLHGGLHHRVLVSNTTYGKLDARPGSKREGTGSLQATA